MLNDPDQALHRARAALAEARARAHDVSAFVALLDDRATAAAIAADARRKAGQSLGALDGVPYAVKDNIFVGGASCTWGSLRWAGHRPPSSDLCVERMDAAGAVLVGLTNMPELAIGQTTSNLAHGTTRHPHDPRLTPGGSSGGSAAAVAAGIVSIALGTDAGGSTRAPASLTGLYGLKTAAGTIPRVHGFPQLVPGFQTIGILAQELKDLGAALAAMRGPDPRDPASLLAGHSPASRPLQVAVFQTVEASTCDPVVRSRIKETADQLRQLGMVVRTVTAPYRWSELLAAWETMAAVGVRAALDTAPGTGPVSEGLLASAAKATEITGNDYLGALTRVTRLRSEVESALHDVDLVLCPTTLSAAWSIDAPGPIFSDGTVPDPSDLGAFTHWVNAVGWAALSVPVEPFADGRPIGVQLVAVKGGEDLLLEVAARLANAVDGSPA